MTDPTATVSIKKMKANESVFPSNDFDVTPSAPHQSTEDGATRSRSHSPISIKTLIVPIKNDYLTVEPFINHNETILSIEQEYALHKFKEHENLFITGPGGTGKTLLIQYFIKYANDIGEKYQVAALTGCAALLLKAKAKTIHSWSGIRLCRGPKSEIISNVMRNKRAINEWKRVKILIIDEVSMMSQKIFEIIEELARMIRHNSEPFGGIQVIFCGDFFQLPPVGTPNEIETSNFCFESPIWNRVFKRENHIELNTIFRQKDPVYISILQQVRIGELDEENQKILQNYVSREKPDNLIMPIKLFPTRAKADYINNVMYSRLTCEEKIYKHTRNTNTRAYLDSGKLIPINILAVCSRLSENEITYELEQLISNSPIVTQLELKIGALVMCTYNVDIDNGICNGTQGIITGFTLKNAPIIKWINGMKTTLDMQYWQSEEFPTISVGQYPLILSWAMTIHKIQGASLDMAEMDLGANIFEYSQTYVALSRVKCLEGLYLSAFQASKIKVNPKVKYFYENMGSITKEHMHTELEKKKDETGIDLNKFNYVPSNVKIVRF